MVACESLHKLPVQLYNRIRPFSRYIFEKGREFLNFLMQFFQGAYSGAFRLSTMSTFFSFRYITRFTKTLNTTVSRADHT